jgi:ABC-2 type transport system permease protein
MFEVAAFELRRRRRGVVVSVLVAATVGLLLGESIDTTDLALMHVVGGLYLLVCAAIGLLASVVVDRPRRAQGIGLGVVFGGYLLDTLTLDTDFEWVGAFAQSRYIDPGDLLTRGEIDPEGVAVLVVGVCLLVIVAAELFERRDVPG